jgi:hypothetical protein
MESVDIEKAVTAAANAFKSSGWAEMEPEKQMSS